jgi:hypothetical protein
MPYLFIASDRHVEGPCAPYLVVAFSEVTHARHPLQLAIPIPLASIFAWCTRHIRQRLITISPLLQGSVMFSHGTRNYGFVAAGVPDDVEKLGSSATFLAAPR